MESVYLKLGGEKLRKQTAESFGQRWNLLHKNLCCKIFLKTVKTVLQWLQRYL